MSTTPHTPAATARPGTRCDAPPASPACCTCSRSSRSRPWRLYKPVKDHVGTFLLGAGSDTGVMWARPVGGHRRPGRHRHRRRAVPGAQAAERDALPSASWPPGSLETSLIFVGVVSMLSIVTLRNDVAGTAGTDSASVVTTGHTLVAVYTWTFLLSQSLMPVIVDLLLGYLLYRSGLVPRVLPLHRVRRRPVAPGLRPRGLLRRLRERVTIGRSSLRSRSPCSSSPSASTWSSRGSSPPRPCSHRATDVRVPGTCSCPTERRQGDRRAGRRRQLKASVVSGGVHRPVGSRHTVSARWRCRSSIRGSKHGEGVPLLTAQGSPGP